MSVETESAEGREICRGCAEVADSLGITLRNPHRSCRKVTLDHVAQAAHRLGVSVMEMFKPL